MGNIERILIAIISIAQANYSFPAKCFHSITKFYHYIRIRAFLSMM